MDLLKKLNKRFSYYNRVRHLDDLAPFSFYYKGLKVSDDSSAEEVRRHLKSIGSSGSITLSNDKMSNLRYYHYPTGKVLKLSGDAPVHLIRLLGKDNSIIRFTLIHPCPQSSFSFNFEVTLKSSGELGTGVGGSFLFIK